MKEKCRKIIQFIVNPRLLLCFGIAWIVTNGWAYILFAIGTVWEIQWMMAVAGGYLAFLWLPVSPEKIVTVALAMVLLRYLFPGDTKTLGVLRTFRDRLKQGRDNRNKR